MKRGCKTWLAGLLAGAILVATSGCKKMKPKANPWARALPQSTATFGLPAEEDARVTLNRKQLMLSGKPLLKLQDGRLKATALRDGADGLYVPRLARALSPLAKRRADGKASHGRLAVLCQPAVPFRTLRAVLYTAMRTGFYRPWLVVEGAGGKRVGLPLEFPSVTSDLSHGLRPSPTRTPPLAVGCTGTGLHLARWGRADCPKGDVAGPAGCPSLGLGSPGAGLGRLRAHLRDHHRAWASRPGRRRPPSNAIMVWAGLDTPVGRFVHLLDAVREAPGGIGSCRILPDAKTPRWKRASPLWNPKGDSPKGCLYYQTVLVWSKPGHRKQ